MVSMIGPLIKFNLRGPPWKAGPLHLYERRMISPGNLYPLRLNKAFACNGSVLLFLPALCRLFVTTLSRKDNPNWQIVDFFPSIVYTVKVQKREGWKWILLKRTSRRKGMMSLIQQWDSLFHSVFLQQCSLSEQSFISSVHNASRPPGTSGGRFLFHLFPALATVRPRSYRTLWWYTHLMAVPP